MTPEKDSVLCAKYPKIFRDRFASPQETAMCWGFACGDGWYDIIDVLCGEIQHHVDYVLRQQQFMFERGEISEKVPEEQLQVVATQVKEKFGALRFYYSGGDEWVRGVVDMAEAISARTCEMCGSSGKQTDTVWIRTLCPSCTAAWESQRFGVTRERT